MVSTIQDNLPRPCDPRAIATTLFDWLRSRLDNSGRQWLDRAREQLAQQPTEAILFTRFSAAARQVGKADLQLTPAELQTAQTLRSGWQPIHWSVDQATRSFLLLSFPAQERDRYVAAVEKLFSAADVAEQVALYQSLPILPHPEQFVTRAIDGLRNHITAVFNAIALRNPYPADYFAEAAWNQMVLKTLFVDSKLSQIHGLDARTNATLARMLSDYAHERWAAGRAVNPQLWRPLGPFAEGNLVGDLERVIETGEPFEQEAAALACASAQTPEAQKLLAKVPDLQQRIANGELTWASFSQQHP